MNRKQFMDKYSNTGACYHTKQTELCQHPVVAEDGVTYFVDTNTRDAISDAQLMYPNVREPQIVTAIIRVLNSLPDSQIIH